MKFVEKFVNLPKLVRRIWILLWAILLGLSAIKILFNKWYPIVVEDVNFTNICEFIDSNVVLKYGIMLLFYILSVNIIFLTTIKRMWYRKIQDFIVINVLIIFSYYMKSIGNALGVLVEFAYLILIPALINIKTKPFTKKWLNILMPLFVYIALNIWQLNMLFIKDVETLLSNAPTLIWLIIQLDYYTFLLITWIGVNYFMGLLSAGWFFGKSETELLAIKEKELAKEKPDMKLVEDIDKELKRREEEK
jgi:hypothetical protein